MEPRTAYVRAGRPRGTSAVPRMRSAMGPLEWLLGAMSAAMLVLALWTGVEVKRLGADLQGLKAAAAGAQAENERLKAKLERLESPERLASLGCRLGLHKPEGRQTVYLK